MCIELLVYAEMCGRINYGLVDKDKKMFQFMACPVYDQSRALSVWCIVGGDTRNWSGGGKTNVMCCKVTSTPTIHIVQSIIKMENRVTSTQVPWTPQT